MVAAVHVGPVVEMERPRREQPAHCLGPEPALAELSGAVTFRSSQRRVEPALQLQVARLRHGPCNVLRAEEIALRIARRLLAADHAEVILQPVEVSEENDSGFVEPGGRRKA